MRAAAWLERVLVVVGVVCLGWAAATWLDARMFQREQGLVLERARVGQSASAASNSVDEYGPIGRLDIPRLGVSVVVMPGEDETPQRKAVGHLADTPLPWDGGNTALAGHRDSFFRPLGWVKTGDDIYLDTPRGRFHYRVRRTVVVGPEDLRVLDPSPNASLTLITCYPFRYVGPAPQRFIVQADRV